MVEIEVNCALSVELIDALNKDKIDLALVTRQASRQIGEDLRTEPLVWIGLPGGLAHTRDVLPLALFSSTDSTCCFRYGALDILKEAGRKYHIAYTSRNTSVLLSAVRSGLAIAVLARSSVPPDLMILGEEDGLPKLPEIGIALHRKAGPRAAVVDDFGDHIVKALTYDNQDQSGS